jgi:uncharacterized protein (DUF427 family)
VEQEIEYLRVERKWNTKTDALCVRQGTTSAYSKSVGMRANRNFFWKKPEYPGSEKNQR